MPTDTRERGIAGSARHNGSDLVTTRASAVVTAAQLNVVSTPSGALVSLPGQGGVVVAPGFGERAGGWLSDHLEPGASLLHPDPDAARALQVLSCVGNTVTVVSGLASGATGTVYGKHGAVLAFLERADLLRLRPGDDVVVDTVGCGLNLLEAPDIAVHSCSPSLMDSLIWMQKGDRRLHLNVSAVLPARTAAAGIGMPSNAYNIDLQIAGAFDKAEDRLRLGDMVGLDDHDHRFGRQHREGWVAIGVLAHGSSAGGGHGYGMTTLLSGPRELFVLHEGPTSGPRLLAGLP